MLSRRSGIVPAGGELFRGFVEDVVGSVLQGYASGSISNLEDLKKNLKDEAFNLVIHGGSGFRSRLSDSLVLADRLMEEVAVGFESVYDVVVDLNFYLRDKGLTGVSTGLFQSAFEVGLEIDPLLGLPVYRGSSIRGALRSVFEDLVGRDNSLVEVLFGSSSGKKSGIGLLEVSDALPVGCLGSNCQSSGQRCGCLIYVGDVIAPHYVKPGSGLVEAEYEAEPTPVQYVAIAPGTVFRVVIGIRDPVKLAGTDENKNKLKKEIVELLVKAQEKGLIPQGIPRSTLEGDYHYYLGVLVGRLLVEAFNRGFAAKASKGYNVLDLVPQNVSIAKTVVHVERNTQRHTQQSRRGPSGGQQRYRPRGGGRRGGMPGSRGPRSSSSTRHSYGYPGRRRP